MSKPKKILIVEDSTVQRVMLQRLLQRAGYRFLSAKDGVEGLALVRAQRPALVISDVTMPNMDGYEMCWKIKKDPELRDVPVLLLTNMDDPKEVIRGLEVGADNYLTKPAEDQHLLERIHFFLTLTDEERGAGGPHGMMVPFAGQRYKIKTGRRQTMNMLLSTYESAVRKNRELIRTQKIIREKDALLIKTIKDASCAKSDFIANLSHEIRTPMNAIVGLTNLALRAKPDPNIQDYLEKIENASQSLMGCLNDILDFSRIEAGKLELYPVLFNPHDMFNSLSDMFGDQSADKGLELVFSIPNDYFNSVFGDNKRLQQILINLLRNAVKFTKQGTIVVKAHPSKVKTGPIELEFSIQDTGIGIAPEQIDALFSPFSQADPSIAVKYGGSGLGLNICNQLVGMMGGRIWVESTLGQGSVFHFTVRLECQVATHTEMIVPSYLRNIRILVVDDHDLTREVMRDMLSGFKLTSEIADSGESALTVLLAAHVEGKPFDLVFMDWRMPGMDGIETTAAIHTKLAEWAKRATTNNQQKPPKMIMLTAFGKNTLKSLAQTSGVDLFLHKPLTRVQLFNAILEVFGEGAPKDNRSEHVFSEELAIIEKISGAQVLLAEDNLVNQQVARELLERVGVIVKIVNNGKKALQMLEQEPFDLVLMDVQMPDMDGHEATLYIRRDPRFAQLPIIAMTAHVLASAREKSISVGMNDHITKPIHIHQLYETLVKWINPDGTDPRFGRVLPKRSYPTVQEAVLPPTLDGIDLPSAMERFRGQQAFFKKMLLGFHHYAAIADEIRQALKWNDLKAAKDMVHTMKGMAGNLSATLLYQATKELEQAIEQGEVEEMSALLIPFERELHRILNSVRSLDQVQVAVPSKEQAPVPPEEPKDAVSFIPGIAPLFKKLSHYLKVRDTDAELSLASLKNILTDTAWEKELQQMETQINQFDYRGALATLEALENSMRGTFEGAVS